MRANGYGPVPPNGSAPPSGGPGYPREQRRGEQVRSGIVPPLARPFSTRPESAPGLEQMLMPGSAVLLAPHQAAKAPDWEAATGKTQLAAYAAQSLRWPGGLDLIAWVPAADRASVLAGYAQAAARLGLDQTGDAEAVAARFAAWLRSAPRPWLVVLDDLRDPGDVEGLWPTGAPGRLLVTAADPGTLEGRAQVLPVGCLTPREAVGYLSERLSTDPDHRSGQLDLALALDGEPAALAHAGSVIETSELSCREYQEIFLGQKAQLEQAGTGSMTAAAVTWTLSARHAEILSPGGGTWPMLVLAAMLAGQGIPLAVLTAPAVCQYLGAGDGPAGAEGAWAAVRALGGAGLLDVDRAAAPPIARMSSALQASVLGAAPPELAELAAGAAADALLQAWSKGQPRTPLTILLRACATSLLHAAGDVLWAAGSCHRVLLTAGQSLDAAGLTGPATAWWQLLAQGSGRILGGRHPDTLVAGGLLADALLTCGRAGEAVTWSEWVLGARTEALGPAHRGTIAARAALGRALTAAGRFPEAVTILEDTVRLSEQVCGPDDEATLSAIEQQAATCLANGQPDRAVQLLRRALEGRETTQGRESTAALAARARLAAACQESGQFRKAIAHYEKLLAFTERANGQDHPDTLAALAALAGACSATGQLGAALQHYQRAAAGYEQTLGPGHPDTLACQGALARAYYDVGHASEAVTLLHAAIAAAGQALSPEDPGVVGLRRLLIEISDDMTTQ